MTTQSPADPPDSPALPAGYRVCPLDATMADALMRFYNGLSTESKRTFRPLGAQTDLTTCRGICNANTLTRPDRYDRVVLHGDVIVGWGFLWDLQTDRPQLGLGIADAHQGKGVGKTLMGAVLAWARQQCIRTIGLIAVEDNAAALGLYRSFGFAITGQQVDERDGLTYHRMTVDLA